MTQINFTARYIRPANIKKLDGNSYKPHTASLVEMEDADRPALEFIEDCWRTPITKQIRRESRRIGAEGLHIYAVTSQADKFEKLNPDNVLGMMLFQEGKSLRPYNKIELLQVSPTEMSPNYGSTINKKWKKFISTVFRFRDPEYKHIGKSLLDSVKAMHSDKPIRVFALQEAISFYEHNGFKITPESKTKHLLEWIK